MRSLLRFIFGGKEEENVISPVPNLPNVDCSQIIRTYPKLIKEDFSKHD